MPSALSLTVSNRMAEPEKEEYKVRLSAASKVLNNAGIISAACLGGFVCGTCRVEISTRDDLFSQHMRKEPHKVKNWNSILEAIKVVATSFSSLESAQKYRNPANHCEVLEPIPGLDILKARRCCEENCYWMCESIRALREHLRRKHKKSGIPISTLRAIPEVTAQTLRKRKSDRVLFEVYGGTKIEKKAENTASIAVKSGANGNTQLSDLRQLLENYNSFIAPNISEAGPKDSREESAFVFVAKTQLLLERHGLDRGRAVELVKGVREARDLFFSEEACKNLTKAVRDYLYEIAELYRCGNLDVFEHILTDYAAPGRTQKKRQFSFLSFDCQGSKTLNRYVNNIVPLILMCCRVHKKGEKAYPKIKMSTELGLAVDVLIANMSGPSLPLVENLKKSVHDVLRLVLLERGGRSKGPSSLFISAFCACICVSEDAKGEDRSTRFRLGIEVSPHLSAVLYAASCAAIKEYAKNPGRLGSEEEHLMRKTLFDVGAESAVGVLTALRVKCRLVREMEYAKESYQKCEEHENCGFQDGIELSACDVGNTVKRIHASLHEKMWGISGLMRGRPVPKWVICGIDSLRDDMSEATCGFSFERNPHNESLLKRSREWVLENIVDALSDPERKRWVQDASKIIEEMVAMLYLVGGAPARGTEMGLLQVENTAFSKRNVFLDGRRCVIAPLYSKMRVLKGGAITAVTRHLDATSSRLLKAYLVLARPWIIILARAWDIIRVKMLQRDLNMGRISPHEFRTEENMILEAGEKRKYLLLLEKAKANRAGTIIGQVLRQYGLPMSISEYRQWQRGLVKRLIGWYELLLVQKIWKGSKRKWMRWIRPS